METFGTIEKPTSILRIRTNQIYRNCNLTAKRIYMDPKKYYLGHNQLSAQVSACFDTYFPSSVGKAPKKMKFEKFHNEKSSLIDFNQIELPLNHIDKVEEQNYTLNNVRIHQNPILENLTSVYDDVLIKRIEKGKGLISLDFFNDIIYLFFSSTRDSIAFYKENRNICKINFVGKHSYNEEKCRVLKGNNAPVFGCYDVFLENIEQHSSESFIKKNQNKIFKISEMIDSGLLSFEKAAVINEVDRFDELNNKIILFNRLSRLFTPVESKRIEDMFKAGNIDIIMCNAKELCVGSQTNIFLQDVLKTLTEEQLIEFIHRLEYDIGPISATKYGAYVIQGIINLSKNKEARQVVVKYFERFSEFLVTHPLGNYSIQNVAKFEPVFLLKIFMKNFKQIINTKIGTRVFKKSLCLFSSDFKNLLVSIKQCDTLFVDEIVKHMEKYQCTRKYITNHMTSS